MEVPRVLRAERRRERSMRGAWGDRGWWDIFGCVERRGGGGGERIQARGKRGEGGVGRRLKGDY